MIDNWASGADTSLDGLEEPLETSVGEAPEYIRQERYGSPDHDDHAPVLPAEAAFRHSGEAPLRRRVYQALLRTGQSCRRVANFADCGNTLWLMRDGTEPVLVCGKCHDRLCPACQRERQAAVVEGILLRMHDCRGVCRFVTLTLKHRDQPLADQLARLHACFKLLRTNSPVAHLMRGGAWFLEVKVSKRDGLWHPHLHVIVEGEYCDAKKLSAAWLGVTGDSSVVDIRSIEDAAKRARYVAKYSTKALDVSVSRVPARLDEFVVAIKGKRLYQCFGTWAKAVKREKLPPRRLTRVAHLSVLHRMALEGDAESRFWLNVCHGRWPRLRRLFPLAGSGGAPPNPPSEREATAGLPFEGVALATA